MKEIDLKNGSCVRYSMIDTEKHNIILKMEEPPLSYDYKQFYFREKLDATL